MDVFSLKTDQAFLFEGRSVFFFNSYSGVKTMSLFSSYESSRVKAAMRSFSSVKGDIMINNPFSGIPSQFSFIFRFVGNISSFSIINKYLNKKSFITNTYLKNRLVNII